MVLISSAKLSNWSRVVLISFAEILGHLIPKNARFCRFCTVKRSKSAQIFLARFARQFFSGRCFLFHQPDLQICQGGSYFICQILKLSLGVLSIYFRIFCVGRVKKSDLRVWRGKISKCREIEKTQVCVTSKLITE